MIPNLPRTRFDGGVYQMPRIAECCHRPRVIECDHCGRWLCRDHQWTCGECSALYCERCAETWAEFDDTHKCRDCRPWVCDDCGRQYPHDAPPCPCRETPGSVGAEESRSIDAICEREARHMAALFGEDECERAKQ